MNLLHIESRSSKRVEDEYEFLVECDSGSGSLPDALQKIRALSSHFSVVSREYKDNAGEDLKAAESCLK